MLRSHKQGLIERLSDGGLLAIAAVLMILLVVCGVLALTATSANAGVTRYRGESLSVGDLVTQDGSGLAVKTTSSTDIPLGVVTNVNIFSNAALVNIVNTDNVYVNADEAIAIGEFIGPSSGTAGTVVGEATMQDNSFAIAVAASAGGQVEIRFVTLNPDSDDAPSNASFLTASAEAGLSNETVLNSEAVLETLLGAINVIVSTEMNSESKIEALAGAINFIVATEINSEAKIEALAGAINFIVSTEISNESQLEALIGSINIIISSELDSESKIEALAGAINILVSTEINDETKLEALTGLAFHLEGRDLEMSTYGIDGDGTQRRIPFDVNNDGTDDLHVGNDGTYDYVLFGTVSDPTQNTARGFRYSTGDLEYNDSGSWGDVGGGTDTDAFHKSQASEITALTEEGSPAAGVMFLAETTAGAKRKVDFANLPGAGSGEANTMQNVGAAAEVYKIKTGVMFSLRTIGAAAGQYDGSIVTGYSPDGNEVVIGVVGMMHSSSGDAALTAEGQQQMKADEDGIARHYGSSGEAQGEVFESCLKKWAGNFIDPNGLYSIDHEFKIADVGPEAPHGVTIVKIKVENNTSSYELTASLCYADNFLTQANEVVIDVVTTSSGTITIDSGFDTALVPNGKVVYLKLTAEPNAALTQSFITVWHYAEED